MNEDQKKAWMAKYNMLTPEEFEDVRQQVVKAKLSQQSQSAGNLSPTIWLYSCFAWSDFCLIEIGIIYGVAVLTMLVCLSQVYYNAALYKVLQYAVWLTYRPISGLAIRYIVAA
jgi:hypothetical protein